MIDFWEKPYYVINIEQMVFNIYFQTYSFLQCIFNY